MKVFFWQLNKNLLRSQRGSAMVLALTAVALLGLMASATMSIAGLLAAEAQRKNQNDLVVNFSQALEAIATHPAACKGTGTGGGPNVVQGIGFGASGGNRQKCDAVTCLAPALAARRLNVALDTNFGPDATAGAEFNAQGIRVESLYLTLDPATVVTAGGTTTVRGNLMAQLSTLNPVISFAARDIGLMTLVFNTGTSDLISCNASPSAQALCESMNCEYTPTSTQQKCMCGFPPLDCYSGGQKQYIDGYDTATNTPICKSVSLNCPQGLFFGGIDGNGQPLCYPVEGAYGPTPTPMPTATATPTPTPTATPPACIADRDNVGGSVCPVGSGGCPQVSGFPNSQCCSGIMWKQAVPEGEQRDHTCGSPPPVGAFGDLCGGAPGSACGPPDDVRVDCGTRYINNFESVQMWGKCNNAGQVEQGEN